MEKLKTTVSRAFGNAPKIPLSFAGWGFGWAFSEIMYINPPFDFSLGHGSAAFLCYDVSTIVIAVALAIGAFFFAEDILPLKRRDCWFVAAAVGFVACVLLNFAAMFGIVPVAPATWLAAFCAGVGSALSYALWGELFGCLSPVRMVMAYACGVALRFIVIWLVAPLPPDRVFICMLVISVLALASLRRSYSMLAKEDLPSSPSGRFSFPAKPMAVIALCAFAFAMLMSFVGNDYGVNGNPGVLVAAAIVVVVVSRRGEDFNFSFLWILSLAFMLAALVPFGHISMSAIFVSGVLGSVSYTLYLMLTSVIFSNLSYRYAVSAAWLFSIEIATRLSFAHAGSYVGELSKGIVGAESTIWSIGICAIPVVIFAVAMVIVFSAKGLDSSWGVVLKQPVSKDYELALEKTRLGVRCREVARTCGLTPREEEVLLLLWRGGKPTDIADELSLSVSTVRTHIKHVYAKLDVHSSKELKALIEVSD